MKVYTYIMISIILIIFFNFAGLSGNVDVLTLIGFNRNTLTNEVTFNPTLSGLYNGIFGTAGILILFSISAGLVIGYLTKSSPENYIILPVITSVFVLFIATFADITKTALSSYPLWVGGITILLLGVHTVGFVVSLVEFFRGTD